MANRAPIIARLADEINDQAKTAAGMSRVITGVKSDLFDALTLGAHTDVEKKNIATDLKTVVQAKHDSIRVVAGLPRKNARQKATLQTVLTEITGRIAGTITTPYA